MKTAFFTAVALVCFITGAQAHARHHHYRHHIHARGHGIVVSFGAALEHMRESGERRQAQQFQFGFPTFPQQPAPVRLYDRGEIVSHPAGCPSRAFCGCGVSVRVFGHSVRSLWLAANWYAFPRAVAATGMVAIFGRHHVAYIESVGSDGIATIYDPNSGGHLTRVHRASIRSATVVDPNGSRYARGI